MTDKIGELAVEIIADTSKFDKGIDSAKKGTEKFDTGLTSLSGTVKKLLGAGALIALAAKVADIGKASISAASDAQETQNKFDVVFSGISGYANDMAESLATSYGTSIQGAKDMLGGTGDLLTGLGFTQESAFDLSKQVLTLGSDLASFTNYSGGAEGASEALTKALLGEREMLKGLGISINEADLKAQVLLDSQNGLTFETDKQAKAAATLSLVYSQTANAQDDFKNSSDSYANQMKVAKARTADLQVELGRALLPTATKGVGIFGDLAGKLGDYLKGLNDIKEAELAQAAGLQTKEQELFLLNAKLEAEEKNIKAQELLIETYKYQGDQYTDAYKEEKRLSGLRASSIKRSIAYVEQEIEVVADLEQQEIDRIKTQEEKKALEEKKAKALALQHEVELDDIEKIIEANKTDIEIIDDQIAQLEKYTTLDGEQKKEQLKAIEILQKEKKDILESEVRDEYKAKKEVQEGVVAHNEKVLERREELAQKRQEYLDEEIKAEEKAQKERKELIEQYAQLAVEIYASIVTVSENASNEEIRIKEVALDKQIEINNASLKSSIAANDEQLESELNLNKSILELEQTRLSNLKKANSEALNSELKLSQDKLNIKLGELNTITAAEQDLLDFKEQLASEDLKISIAETEAEIKNLLTTGEIEDKLEAEALQRDLDNDKTLRDLASAAKAEEETRIAEIATAKAEALAEKEALEIAAQEAELQRIADLTEAQDIAAAEELRLARQSAANEARINEEAATEEARIKKETALAVWEIEKEQFEASKKLALIQIAVDTSLGVAKALAQGGVLGIATGVAVGAAGLAQAHIISSQPEPPKPAFAKGGTATHATSAIVGEDGGEVMLGMGAAGSPLIDELASRIAAKSGGGVTNNYYQSMFNTTNPSDLRKFNRINRPYAVAEDQRIGAKA